MFYRNFVWKIMKNSYTSIDLRQQEFGVIERNY